MAEQKSFFTKTLLASDLAGVPTVLLADVEVTVYDAAGAVATIYEPLTPAITKSNPFIPTDGVASFWAFPAYYRIHFHDALLSRFADYDVYWDATSARDGGTNAIFIEDNSIAGAKLVDLGVVTSKIADENVTGAKIEDNARIIAAISTAAEKRNGICVVPTDESRTNVAYGTLTTPDLIEDIVVPANGLLMVAFEAQFRCDQVDAGHAAIFIGANQLKCTQVGQAAAQLQSAPTAQASNWQQLFSTPIGLAATQGTLSYSMVTTGQALGIASDSVGPGGNTRYALDNANIKTIAAPSGGVCCVRGLAAGTYDVSVQYMATSGTVSARNRKLLAWSRGCV